MMAGRKVAADAYLIPPLGLVTRESTDVLAVADAEVSAAMRYIREHACDGIGVEDVLAHVPVSRRLPLATVAARAGFNYVEYMSVVFKKKTGVPPSDYRAAQRKFAAR